MARLDLVDMKQLDPNSMDLDDKEFLTGLQQVLSAQDLKNIDLHSQLARSAKTGLDGLYFKRPAVFTLLSLDFAR